MILLILSFFLLAVSFPLACIAFCGALWASQWWTGRVLELMEYGLILAALAGCLMMWLGHPYAA